MPPSETVSPPADLEIDSRDGSLRPWRRWLVLATSWLVSLTLHGGLLVVLGLWLWPWPHSSNVDGLLAQRTTEEPSLPLETETLLPPLGAEVRITSGAASSVSAPPQLVPPSLTEPVQRQAAPPALVTPTGSDLTIPRPGFGTAAEGSASRGLAGRGARRQAASGRGATGESERAVTRALRWLIEHQAPNGSWSLDHRQTACRGSCTHPGRLAPSHRAATALALLTLMGAGHSAFDGKHQDEVLRGLEFLMSGQHASGSLMDEDLQLHRKRRDAIEVLIVPQGNLYSHGLATLALCEAYAMGKSRPGPKARQFNARLQTAAEAALRFTSYAQDPRGGGWRYLPRPLAGGDLSVTGWQVMALKSGQLAGLAVDPTTLGATSRFLDATGNAATGRFQYRPAAPGDTPNGTPIPAAALYRETTTAIGLLCRMYLGWDQNHPAIQQGATFLANRGPSLPDRPDRAPDVDRGAWALAAQPLTELDPAATPAEPPEPATQAEQTIDLYENYYATLVLFHFTHGEGPLWEAWHEPLRDYLVASQQRRRHASGSWFFGHRGHANSAAGGRLYCTCMAAMTLEVYYRYAPLYRLDSEPVRGVPGGQTETPNL